MEDRIKINLLVSKGEKTSCAVIGNGKSVSDLSSEIKDSYIMRCNRIKTKDRTDLNISSLYNEVSEKLPCPVLGVLPISETMYQKYVEAKKMHLSWLNNAQKLINKGNTVWTYDDNDSYSEVFKSVAEEINAFPTTGLMGIATARWMGFERIIITGFTFFEGKSYTPHHKPDNEKCLIKKWIDADDRKYIIDELTQQYLWG